MKKIIVLSAILFFAISAKTQQTFTSYRSVFVVYKYNKFVTERDVYTEINFILNGNILHVEDEANSRYYISNDGRINYDDVGKYTTFSAIDEKDRRCSIILLVPYDKSRSSVVSIYYETWGVIYSIK